MQTEQNVDLEQLAHFNALADGWWDEDGALRMLHAMNPLRLDYIRQHSGPLFGKRVLDIGCGAGILAASMALEGALVTGIDASPEVIRAAQSHATSHTLPITYLEATAEAHAADAHNCYEVITCMELLEHLPNPSAALQACAKMLVPGGWLFCSTLNRNLKSWWLAIVGAEYLFGMVPKGSHQFAKFIRPSELCRWLDATPIKPRNISGLRYNPLLRRFSFSSDLSVNYLLAAHYPG